jgi:hypothetical protein
MRRCHRLQPVDEGVAGNQRPAGGDVAGAVFTVTLPPSLAIAACPRVLVQPRPGCCGSPRQPDHVFQRIDVARPRVMRCRRDSASSPPAAAKLLAVEKPHTFIAILLGHDLHVLAVVLDIARLVRGRDLARAEIGVDVVGCGKARADASSPARPRQTAPCTLAAEIRLAFLHPGPLAGAELPAIAARSAVAEARAFDQHHVLAARRQVIGRLQPGEAAADDHHVGSRGSVAGRRRRDARRASPHRTRCPVRWGFGKS